MDPPPNQAPACTTMPSHMEPDEVLLHFEQWQSEERREAKRQAKREGRYVQTFIVILAVGAIVASVQTQLLTLILDLDPSTLPVQTCISISFVGLVLVIAGTFFGAVNAIRLQLMAQRGTRALGYMEECKENLQALVKYITESKANSPSTLPM
ncbi:hypothetical protein BKA70DRAFT_846787 [Coprinopsis sp. MPI-PUGE-AT-0042]|nr:hypothetical protein BKA70DRAFT_846787 [Coprinopsis sp. MPI-PUGE-AT-0042]